MENSAIEWTTHTFNPWRGCTKVSAGCANCYADTLAKRNPGVLGVWGPQGTRVVASEAKWAEPVKWNAIAELANDMANDEGVREKYLEAAAAHLAKPRPRVFCASMADVFEEWLGSMVTPKGQPLHKSHPTLPLTQLVRMDDIRTRLFDLIDSTPSLDWLLLTKRPQNVMPTLHGMSMLSGGSGAAENWLHGGLPQNVWIGTSVEDRKAKPRIDALRTIPAAVRFLSVEPLLEGLGELDLTGIHWVIVGGESGHGARSMDPSWARSIRDQCQSAKVAFFMKQMGQNRAITLRTISSPPYREPVKPASRDKKGGDWNEWPFDLRIREFPKVEGMDR